MAKLTVITGAAGFIGSNLVSALNARGNSNLLLVDQLGTKEKWRNLLGLRFEDMLSIDQFINKLSRINSSWDISAVIHLGACSATTQTDGDYLLHNNYQYTRKLCQWCLENDARFIYASSAATYGDGANGYNDSAQITPKLRPLNMYGYSKQMFDLWALKQNLFEKIVGLKYFNVYGPGEGHKENMRSLVNKAYYQINETGGLNLFKSHKKEYLDGQQKRDFIYVKDAVDVTLHFLDNPDVGGLLNCGTGQARTWNDLATAIFNAMGKEKKIKYIDIPENIREKYQYFTQADITKLRQAGYDKPFTTLEDGVKDYVQNHLMTGRCA